MITAQEVTLLIKQSLPDAQIEVKDMGGGDHLEVNVVSEEFFLMLRLRLRAVPEQLTS